MASQEPGRHKPNIGCFLLLYIPGYIPSTVLPSFSNPRIGGVFKQETLELDLRRLKQEHLVDWPVENDIFRRQQQQQAPTVVSVLGQIN